MPRPRKIKNEEDEHVEVGTIIVDSTNNEKWCVGPLLGQGSCGKIYSARRENSSNYDCVLKCEPLKNEPLYTELKFYWEYARPELIERYKQENNLQHLGIVSMLSHGTFEFNGQMLRFIVLPRYCMDFLTYSQDQQGLDEEQVYRMAIQMLDALQFVHQTHHAHTDIKSENILLDTPKGDLFDAYLIDFGMVLPFNLEEFKPERRLKHTGTTEYASMDMHQGVPTMRGDLEMLGYNLIEWVGGNIPWNNEKSGPKIQTAKKRFLKNIEANVTPLFHPYNDVSNVIIEYMTYVQSLKFNELPNYQLCRNIFLKALQKDKRTWHQPELRPRDNAFEPSPRIITDLSIKTPTKRKTDELPQFTKRMKLPSLEAGSEGFIKVNRFSGILPSGKSTIELDLNICAQKDDLFLLNMYRKYPDPADMTHSIAVIEIGNHRKNLIDQAGSSKSSIDQGSSSKASIDQRSSSKASIDQGISSKASIDQGSSFHASIDQGSSFHASVDNGSSSKASIDQGNSSKAAIDQGNTSKALISKGNCSDSNELRGNTVQKLKTLVVRLKRLHIEKKTETAVKTKPKRKYRRRRY